MKEYLVRSQEKGYYLSSQEEIEKKNEMGDEIVSSWEKGNSNQKITEIATYLSRDAFKSQKDIENIVNTCKDSNDISDIVYYIIENLVFDYYTGNVERIRFLYKNDILNKDEYSQLFKLNDESYYIQLIMIKNYINELIKLYPDTDFNWVLGELSVHMEEVKPANNPMVKMMKGLG